MEVINFKNIGNTFLKRKALEILSAGVNSAMPDRILPQSVSYQYGKLKIKEDYF